MNKINIDGYRRINKKEARRRYNNGEIIRFVPCKISPVNIWGFYSDKYYSKNNNSFETVVNTFTYYNCIDYETGTYPAFYIKEG